MALIVMAERAVGSSFQACPVRGGSGLLLEVGGVPGVAWRKAAGRSEEPPTLRKRQNVATVLRLRPSQAARCVCCLRLHAVCCVDFQSMA